jgi:hypothetical protein
VIDDWLELLGDGVIDPTVLQTRLAVARDIALATVAEAAAGAGTAPDEIPVD